jgi:hypothetical protein
MVPIFTEHNDIRFSYDNERARYDVLGTPQGLEQFIFAVDGAFCETGHASIPLIHEDDPMIIALRNNQPDFQAQDYGRYRMMLCEDGMGNMTGTPGTAYVSLFCNAYEDRARRLLEPDLQQAFRIALDKI